MPNAWIVPPGGIIGILGGGQLGRMLSLAAAELGLKTHIYFPETDSPAAQVSTRSTRGDWQNRDALGVFATAVDVITYEFENVPADTASFLAERKPVYPPPRALAVSQDRIAEKSLMVDLGLPVPTFVPVNGPEDLAQALARTGLPAVLKTRRFGYDGKGQSVIREGDDPVAAWEAVGKVPSILESFVAFERELSVLTVRGLDGTAVTYDIAENRHRNGILDETVVPATISAESTKLAEAVGSRIAVSLDYVGALAVELFLAPGRQLMVNEIAPRVHNSFHWTQDACGASQFEQHIRAIAGWPLASPERHSDVRMTNLIGTDAGLWRQIASDPLNRLHLYGKTEARAGRKMGHVNRLLPRSSRSA
ncbi:MAG: 5-(carboxyamino)imidazole ribonucleotide synthase [Bauldia sp.]